MRRIDIITATIAVSALMALASCEKHQEILFDTPFVSISDETGTSSSMNVSNSANNYLTSLRIDVNISGEKYIGDVTIEYEVIAGNGLREGGLCDTEQHAQSRGIYQRHLHHACPAAVETQP